jgi:hypothetical protein
MFPVKRIQPPMQVVLHDALGMWKAAVKNGAITHRSINRIEGQKLHELFLAALGRYNL